MGDASTVQVDVKIKQNIARAATNLPSLLPITPLMYAVFCSVHKINMLPNS